MFKKLKVKKEAVPFTALLLRQENNKEVLKRWFGRGDRLADFRFSREGNRGNSPRHKRGMSVQCGTNGKTGGMHYKHCAVRIKHCHWTSSCHDPLLRRGMPFFLLQRGVLLRDVTTIDTLLRSRDLALLGLSPIVLRAHRARQQQGPLQLRETSDS